LSFIIVLVCVAFIYQFIITRLTRYSHESSFTYRRPTNTHQ